LTKRESTENEKRCSEKEKKKLKEEDKERDYRKWKEKDRPIKKSRTVILLSSPQRLALLQKLISKLMAQYIPRKPLMKFRHRTRTGPNLLQRHLSADNHR